MQKIRGSSQIKAGTVTNTELANFPALTLLGNDHATDPLTPQYLTVAEINAMLGTITASLLTTRGDLIYRNATVPARLPLGGVTGSALINNGTDPAWSASAAALLGAANVFTANQTISNTAPSLILTDTTASAKSLTIAVDANLAQLRESAGASGSLVVLDLVNNRVGLGTATPLGDLDLTRSVDNGVVNFLVINNSTSAGTDTRASFSVRNSVGAAIFNTYGVNATGTFFGVNRANTAFFSDALSSSLSAMGIGLRSNSPLYFATNDLVRATILGSGDMGVGILLPLARFHSVGAASGIGAIIQTGSTPGDALQIRDSLTAIHAYLTATGGAVFNEQGTASGEVRMESDTEPDMFVSDPDADTDGALYFGGRTNGVKINKGGELTLIGTATVWKDIDFPIIIRTVGANIPTLETVNGNLTAPQWQVNDFNMCESQEFIHEWKEGSACYFHIHLTTNGLDATDRYVRFEVEYGYATPSGVWTFPATMDSGDLLIPANTTDKTMFILSLGNFTPTGVEIGGHVLARLKRITSTGTAPTNNPWVPMLQMHVETDSLGSKTISDK